MECPDCRVEPGSMHRAGCVIARCANHGHLLASCQGEGEHANTAWSGESPLIGNARALRLLDEQGRPDTARFSLLIQKNELEWSQTRQRWERPGG